jgi:NADH:ubiquinone oxidoreductase subunit 4 (subunit M)
MLQRVYLGRERPEYLGLPDASRREMAILAPLAALAILLGILPKQTLLDFVSGTLNGILQLAPAAASVLHMAEGGG